MLIVASRTPWLDDALATLDQPSDGATWMRRVLARGNARVQITGDLWHRRTVGALAGATLRQGWRQPTHVIAASLCARPAFAWARARGIRTTLLLDLPNLLALHRDLDQAAADEPDAAFLRNVRAPSWAVAEQAAEFVLADRVVVRGPYPLADVLGHPTKVIVPVRPTRGLRYDPQPTAPLLLAGPASARGGFRLALASARAIGRTLAARRSDAAEPQYLREPGIQWFDREAPPCAAVVAPSRCEAALHEDCRDLPVIRTRAVAPPHTARLDLVAEADVHAWVVAARVALADSAAMR